MFEAKKSSRGDLSPLLARAGRVLRKQLISLRGRVHKKSKRFFKCVATALAVILIMGQGGIVTLADEAGDICSCNVRCSEQGINADCPVCVADYAKCAISETDVMTETSQTPDDMAQVTDGTEETVPGEGTTDTETSGTGTMETETSGTGTSGTGTGTTSTETAGTGTENSDLPDAENDNAGGGTQDEPTDTGTEKTDTSTDLEYTITASAGTGGSIEPSGEITVQSGDAPTFTITPDEGYTIASVLVDEIDVKNDLTEAIEPPAEGAVGAKQYVFKNVAANHTIEANFKVVPVPHKGGNASPPAESSQDSASGGGSDYTPESSPSGGSDYTPKAPAAVPVENADMPSAIDIAPVPVPESAPDVPAPKTPAPPSRGSEPKTGDYAHVEVYATIAMIAGLLYLLLYFADGSSGMTEAQKKEIVGAIVRWAKRGTRLRKYTALAVIFCILVYYHSIGKRTTLDWNELYEE